MSALEELSALYEQWRSLTEDEGGAIKTGAWDQVSHYQSTKLLLQPRITELSGRLDTHTHELEFKTVVEDLMRLERRNNDWLEQQRREAQQQMRELDKTGRNLRQLHNTYVPPARTLWQSYS